MHYFSRMADQFQTSFIPKKTYDVGAVAAPRSSFTGLLSFIAVTLFILSLVSAGGVFLYERYLATSLVRKQESLDRARSAFEPELIRELSRLDAKLAIGQQLLDAHTAPSAVFDLLEEVTLQTVRFTDFSYTVEEGIPRITMQGSAASFASVALQSDEFAKNRSIKEPEFSGLTLDARGNVQFGVTALIDPALVSYREQSAQGASAFLEIESGGAGEGDVAGVSTAL